MMYWDKRVSVCVSVSVCVCVCACVCVCVSRHPFCIQRILTDTLSHLFPTHVLTFYL